MKNILFLFLLPFFALGQKTFTHNGVVSETEPTYAFTNAKIWGANNALIEKGTLVIQGDKILEVGSNVSVPKHAIVTDVSGKYIYPAFVELVSDYGLEGAKLKSTSSHIPQYETNRKGAYAWNEALRSDFSAAEHLELDKKSEEALLKMGIGTVLTHRQDGISRGSSALVAFNQDNAHEALIENTVAHHLSFSKGSSGQSYPTSLMGIISLLRQTYYDAEWYKKGGSQEEKNLSLESWIALEGKPVIFSAGDQLDILRAAKIATEFGHKYILVGEGKAYQRAGEIAKLGMPLVVPINLPEALDVEDPAKAQIAQLDDMKHWELAPANPTILKKAGIEFALTTSGLKKADDVFKNLKRFTSYGLSHADVITALTKTPAQLIGKADLLGTLEKGKLASFFISDKDIFEDKMTIEEVWSKGKKATFEESSSDELQAGYNLDIGGDSYTLTKIDGKVKLVGDKDTTNATFKTENGTIQISFEKEKRKVILWGYELGEGKWKGHFNDENGIEKSWSGSLSTSTLSEDKKENNDTTVVLEIPEVMYPFVGFGWTEKPTQEDVLFKNATIWTNEKEGILIESDILISNGKIRQIGKNLNARGAKVIDASGKHITSGIIDEHTHIAGSRGINEAGQASSAEVRIGDIVDSEDVYIYRHLAGGVTSAQILHGSANPIGGQSQLIKLRWGASPEELKFENADPFIKFALGENVKQSNWGDYQTVRFPQTRMGVEQVFEDYFTRARQYEEKMKSGKLYRRDLDLETILEILNKERFITCHSYQQGEINMLMKVAEKHGFTVNTFTHILEGYKVADKMAKHGAAGSSFSDWWAYKYEVIDAIPYNGAIMHREGVLTSFNSDDREMARRLNQEAAKAVKYGNVSEEDAWKFVTLNPAKMLHVDDRVGSLKVGKDADIVLWSDHPLSIYAKAEQTYVDGIKYFDLEEDLEKRQWIKAEKARLVQKMIDFKKNGGKVTQPKEKEDKHYHCDTFTDEGH